MSRRVMDKYLQSPTPAAYVVYDSMRDDMNRISLWGLFFAGLLSDAANAQMIEGTASASAERPAWDYIGGANNDEDWGRISPDYSTCTVGTSQSPVGINESTPSMMSKMRPHYHSTIVAAQLREQTLILQYGDDKNYLSHEGTDFYLKQVRMHTPSEHDINGTTFPMELQLLHQSKEGHVMIMAVMVKEGDTLSGLEALIANLPDRKKRETRLRFNADMLMTDPSRYYAYEGSLSWPPCHEGVAWRILKDPLSLSRKQILTLSKLTGRNARLLQPLYFRNIKETMN